jgi:uncharacterized protein (UPF0332 family)
VNGPMPFDWSEFLVLADELGKRADEASLRSALSRAYYYVYHLALKRAQDNNFTALSGEGTHTQLWRVFSTNPEFECRKLGEIAIRLKEKRERADYNPFYARIAEEIPDVLADARDFAARLAMLPPRHPNPKSQRQ